MPSFIGVSLESIWILPLIGFCYTFTFSEVLCSAQPVNSLSSRLNATFCLFEVLFGTFTLFVLANRPLFAASKQCKSAQKRLSTKLEIKSKQILTAKIRKNDDMYK